MTDMIDITPTTSLLKSLRNQGLSWHQCVCGIGPVQRDLYSAWLAAHLDPSYTIPSIAHEEWDGAEFWWESLSPCELRARFRV